MRPPEGRQDVKANTPPSAPAVGRRRPERLVDQLDRVRDDVLSADGRRKLAPLFRELDALGRVDARSGEAFIDEGALRKLLRPHVADGFVDELVRRVGGTGNVHVRKAGAGAKPLLWDELVERIAAPEEPSTLEALGLRPDFRPADMEAVLRDRLRGAPEWLYDPNVAPARLERALRSLDTPRPQGIEAPARGTPNTQAFWNCAFAASGYWALIGLVVAVAGLIMAVITAGPFVAAVVAAVDTFFRIWLGGSAIYAIGCFITHIVAPLFQ